MQTDNGHGEFQLRWIGDEAVGVLTDRAERHWFLLDSRDIWYDMTQDRSPTMQLFEQSLSPCQAPGSDTGTTTLQASGPRSS